MRLTDAVCWALAGFAPLRVSVNTCDCGRHRLACAYDLTGFHGAVTP